MHQRGLARTGGSDDGDKFSRVYVQGHAPQRGYADLAHEISLDKIADGDDWLHSAPCFQPRTASSTKRRLSPDLSDFLCKGNLKFSPRLDPRHHYAVECPRGFQMWVLLPESFTART